ncbi:hypothetical protein U1Q18_006797 [Sarracenia purpurea var. burkii]
MHLNLPMASKYSSLPSPPSPKSPSPSSSSARICLCSPSTHPGSFRCSLHRSCRGVSGRSTAHVNRRRGLSEMTTMMPKASLIRVFLMQVIRPSSHACQRRQNFEPRPSRFAGMNRRGNGVTVS